MNRRLVALVLVVLCMILATPALALENPYRHAGEVTGLDIPVPLEADGLKSAGSSGIEFRGAGYTHRIGRVSIAMNPLGQKHDGKIAVDGNLRRYISEGTVVEHEVYRDLVKERIILDLPATVRYSYDLALSDWVTIETDESRPVEIRDANNTVIVTYPYTNEVTNYAKDSTIDIDPDRWGNHVVYVNGEDVVVIPKPFAIDAAGQRFEMDFKLDKKAKTITVAGDLTEAKYPVTVDPTERVTNGGFETGNLSGWTNAIGNTNSYAIKSDSPYQGNYYLDVIGAGGYSGIRQTTLIDYTGATSVSNAAAIPVRNTYDIPMSDIAISGWHWLVNAPGQNVQGWTPRSTSPGLTGSGNLVIWTYSSTHGHIDSVAVNPPLPDPPVADFVGTPLTGTAPLTVQFSDLSTNTPTSWSWTFGDGGTSSVQNPSHQYTSAGTYTVSLTAANAVGSDGETKTGYVVVSAPSFNQATNIEGRTDITGVIEDAAIKQTARNYNPATYIQPSRSIIKSRLPNDQIFFFNGHGNPGTIQTSEQPVERFFAQNSIDGYDFDASSSTNGNMKLAVFLACYTGVTDPVAGNLVDIVTSKGASCAMGWTDFLVTEGNAPWSSAFWSAIEDGKSINQAHVDGLSAAKDHPICKMLDPPEIWQYCKLENLYSQGSGCIHPLPEGMVNFAFEPLTSEKTEFQLFDGFTDTQIKKYKDSEIKAIIKFARNPGINPEYQRSVRYTYGTLDIYTAGDSTYKVNRETGRVQSQINSKIDTQSNGDIISVDQGYPIAEKYAKEKFPELWTSKSNNTHVVVKSVDPLKKGHELAYTWRQYFIPQNSLQNQISEIAGFATVDVTLDARSGEVILYHEWYLPLEKV